MLQKFSLAAQRRSTDSAWGPVVVIKLCSSLLHALGLRLHQDGNSPHTATRLFVSIDLHCSVPPQNGQGQGRHTVSVCALIRFSWMFHHLSVLRLFCAASSTEARRLIGSGIALSWGRFAKPDHVL